MSGERRRRRGRQQPDPPDPGAGGVADPFADFRGGRPARIDVDAAELQGAGDDAAYWQSLQGPRARAEDGSLAVPQAAPGPVLTRRHPDEPDPAVGGVGDTGPVGREPELEVRHRPRRGRRALPLREDETEGSPGAAPDGPHPTGPLPVPPAGYDRGAVPFATGGTPETPDWGAATVPVAGRDAYAGGHDPDGQLLAGRPGEYPAGYHDPYGDADEHGYHDEYGAEHEYDDAYHEEYDEYDDAYHDAHHDAYDLAGTSGARPARRRGRSAFRVLVMLVVVAVVGAGAYGAWLGLRPAVAEISGFFGPSEDFPGPGSGEVTVTVESGSTGEQIGQALVDAGVVASVGAFVGASEDNPDGASIQAGTYTLPQGIPAAQAVEAMLDPASQVRDLLTVTEGLQTAEIVQLVAEYRDVDPGQVEAALGEITLPASAQGDPEGYLYPNSYEFGPDVSLTEILQEIVDEGTAVRAELGIPPDREREIVTIASIAEAEAFPADFGNVVSVINNRLDGGIALQMDSTVKFIYGGQGVTTTDEQRETPHPYNTYDIVGLPPGPIASPGEEALAAALNPPQTDFLYFVTVDLDTGETLFATTLADHEVNVAVFQEWCQSNRGRC